MKKLSFRGIAVLFGLICIIAGAYYLSQRVFVKRLLQLEEATPIREKRLRDTDDISPANDQNFSISPDGRWLFYASSKGNPFEPVFVLYRIADEQRREVSLSPRARELAAQGFGPPKQSGCWSPDSSQVFLAGDSALFAATVQADGAQLTVREAVDPATLRRYAACSETAADVTSLVRVSRISDLEIQLVDPLDPARILARHQAQDSTITRLAAEHFTVSPGRRYVAYVVGEYSGSFIVSSPGYVLKLTSNAAPEEPQRLAGAVLGPIRWGSGDTVVYACVQGRQGDVGIYQWEIKP